MKRRILKAISLICTCVMLLTLAACGEESQDNTGKYIVFKFGNDNIYLDEVYIYAQTTIDEYEKEYGNDIWGKTIETDGGIEMNVEEMARREVISNIVQTKALIAQADEYKISLTAEEQAQAAYEAHLKAVKEECAGMKAQAQGHKEEAVKRIIGKVVGTGGYC